MSPLPRGFFFASLLNFRKTLRRSSTLFSLLPDLVRFLRSAIASEPAWSSFFLVGVDAVLSPGMLQTESALSFSGKSDCEAQLER